MSTSKVDFVSRPLKQAAADPRTPARKLAKLAEQHHLLARRVASNPSTPGKVLAELAKHSDLQVRQAVARHPGTPADTLVRTLWRHPIMLLRNPAWDLLFLEQPDLPLRMDFDLVRSLQRLVRFADHHAETLALHPRIWSRKWLALNLGPVPIPMALLRDPEWSVRYALAKNENLPPNMLAELASDKHGRVRNIVCWVLSHREDVPFRKLVDHPNPQIRIALTKNQNAPEWLLEHLEKDSAATVRTAAGLRKAANTMGLTKAEPRIFLQNQR